jgi:hypothetical protein
MNELHYSLSSTSVNHVTTLENQQPVPFRDLPEYTPMDHEISPDRVTDGVRLDVRNGHGSAMAWPRTNDEPYAAAREPNVA